MLSSPHNAASWGHMARAEKRGVKGCRRHRLSGGELHKRVLTSAEASGLELHARAGVIPTPEAVMCGVTRKDTLSNQPRRRQGRAKGDRMMRIVRSMPPAGGVVHQALGPDGDRGY